MITVFGLGFVGLTTALGFAHYGQTVYGIDVDKKRTTMIEKGKVPFLEEGLDTALQENLGKRFFIAKNPAKAIQKSSIVFYCVGTPCGYKGEADLTYLFAALNQTLENLNGDKKLLVIKSTVPPTTVTQRIIPYIESKGYCIGKDVIVANNPEFLREGHCWQDFVTPDRIVIGCSDPEGIKMLTDVYRPFHAPVCSVTPNTGEFIKYLSNTFLATMISYSNEMSKIADAFGDIDVAKAFQIFHMDKRWHNANMSSYVYPGCGYGGYCLPKDTNALYHTAREHGANPKILGDVIQTNEDMPEWIVSKIAEKVKPTQKLGILGLSFKPNSDDVRDCASAKIMKKLLERGYCNIYAYDPVASQAFQERYNLPIQYLENLSDICKMADVLIILTAWPEFKSLKTRNDLVLLDF